MHFCSLINLLDFPFLFFSNRKIHFSSTFIINFEYPWGQRVDKELFLSHYFQVCYFLLIFAYKTLISLYFINIFDLLDSLANLYLESAKYLELSFIYYFGFACLELKIGNKIISFSSWGLLHYLKEV